MSKRERVTYGPSFVTVAFRFFFTDPKDDFEPAPAADTVPDDELAKIFPTAPPANDPPLDVLRVELLLDLSFFQRLINIFFSLRITFAKHFELVPSS